MQLQLGPRILLDGVADRPDRSGLREDAAELPRFLRRHTPVLVKFDWLVRHNRLPFPACAISTSIWAELWRSAVLTEVLISDVVMPGPPIRLLQVSAARRDAAPIGGR